MHRMVTVIAVTSCHIHSGLEYNPNKHGTVDVVVFLIHCDKIGFRISVNPRG